MKNLFKKLEELYEKFDRKNFHNMEVACHNCGMCCSSGMRFFVSDFEYDFLNKYLKEHNISPDIEVFKRFMIKRDRDFCPYYNGKKGCRVYEARPLCCRLFGNFQFRGEPMPRKSCAYYRKGFKVYNPSQIKEQSEFIELRAKYKLMKAESYEEKVEAIINLSSFYVGEERLNEALHILEKWEEIFPHNVKINYQAGCVYKWMNNLERAGERLERSLELGGIKYYPSIYQTLGYVYAGMGHCDRAEEFFKKALELKPDVQSYTDMALIHLTAGGAGKAFYYCEKALEEEPHNKMALEIKEGLEKILSGEEKRMEREPQV